MFWWFCGDHSNMNMFCNSGNTKAHHDEDDNDNVRRSKYNKKMSTIPEEDDDRFSSIFTYNTMAQYSANRYGAFDDIDDNPIVEQIPLGTEDERKGEINSTKLIVEYACTALSSSIFLLTLPFSLFYSLKFVGPFEQLVVMRLGRIRGVYSQGTVLVLPWVDKATSIDLRVTSIELPPIHVLTADGGMLEVMAVAYTKVNDPLTVCCALQNREQTLHNLAYTTLTRHLTKRLLNEITNPNSLAKILVKCQEELNKFIRRHGVQIDRLTVNQLQVLKPAENAAISVFQTLFKSDIGKQLMGKMGAHFNPTMAPASEGNQQQEKSPTQNCAAEMAAPEKKQFASGMPIPESPKISVDPELDALMSQIRNCLCEPLVKRVNKHFRIKCTDAGAEFDLDLRNNGNGGHGWCGWTWEKVTPLLTPDVHFTLAKSTLLALVNGALSPMSAYMDGRVQIRGSIEDAIALRHLAEFVNKQQNNNGNIEHISTKKSQ